MEEKGKGLSEDWLALWLGLFIFVISLFTFSGTDLLGWGVNTSVWMDPAKAMSPVSSSYKGVSGEIVKIDGQKLILKKADGKEAAITVEESTASLKVGDKNEKKGMSGATSLLLTYISMLVLMCIGAVLLKTDVVKFAIDHDHLLNQLPVLVRRALRVYRSHQGQARGVQHPLGLEPDR